MRRLRNQAGFSLIELTFVLAIISLLTVGVMVGQGIVRQNTEFTTSLDETRDYLRGIQNEAEHAVSERGQTDHSQGGQSHFDFFGKLVRFDITDPQRVRVWTLVQNPHDPNGRLALCDGSERAVAGGLSYGGAAATPDEMVVVFTNHPANSYVVQDVDEAHFVDSTGTPACNPVKATPATTPAVSAAPIPACDGNTDVLNPNNYREDCTSFTAARDIPFWFPDTPQRGHVTINPDTGSIERGVDF